MIYKVEQLTDAVKRNIKDALFEDLGSGDLSARFIADKKVEAHVLLKSECAVLCGTSWFENTFRFVAKAPHVKWEKTDGSKIFQNELICVLKGGGFQSWLEYKMNGSLLFLKIFLLKM